MTKLTITGRAETILGILQKLEICDAQWNINEGFTVALDTTDPEPAPSVAAEEPTDRQPGRRGRPRKVKQDEPCEKGNKAVCELCKSEFKTKAKSARYCPTCKDMYGSTEECDRVKAKLESQGC